MRPVPVPERSARSCRFMPEKIQSKAVLPSPSPSTGSLLVTLTIEQVAPGSVCTLTRILTILWFGGQSTPGLRVTTTGGGVRSTTVMVNDPSARLLWASVAWQFTVVVPSGNRLPDGGTQMTSTLPSTMTTAVAVKLTTAPPGPVDGTVMLAGRVSTGGVVSTTLTV